MEEALAMLGDADPGPAIVLAGEGWAPGVVGIVAAKLVDRYQRPAFVIGIDPATGIGRGSARTSPGINLYEALRARARDAAPLLDRFGGHAAAAGFTIQREAVAALARRSAPRSRRFAEGSGPVRDGPRGRRRGSARRGRRAARARARRPGAVRSGKPGAAARHARRAGHGSAARR